MHTSNSAGYIRMALMGTAFIALTIILIVFQPGSPRNAQTSFEPEGSSIVTRGSDPLVIAPATEIATPIVPSPAPAPAPTPVSAPAPMPRIEMTGQIGENPTNMRDMTFSAISNLKSVTTGEAPAPGQPGSLLYSVVQRSIANGTTARPDASTVTQIEPVSTSTPNQQTTRSYFVRPGDTLLSIAKEVYDDTTMSSEIFRQNTNILTSPDSLKPGMVLKLPTP